MKTVKIIRSEGTLEVARYFLLLPEFQEDELKASLQEVFGNSSTVGCESRLSDSTGKTVAFDSLVNFKAYFLTFQATSLEDFSKEQPVIQIENVKVILPEDYLVQAIEHTKGRVKAIMANLHRKQSDNKHVLNNNLNDLKLVMGNQGLNVLEHEKSIQKTMKTMNEINLPPLVEEAKQVTKNLEIVYQNAPQIPKKGFVRPKTNKKLNLKDFPMNEIHPAEFKRFLKYQSMFEDETESVQLPPSRSASNLLPNSSKVLINKEWSLSMGYAMIQDETLKLTRTPSFKDCDEYFLKDISNVITKREQSEMTLHLTFMDGQSMSLEFDDPLTFSVWTKMLNNRILNI